MYPFSLPRFELGTIKQYQNLKATALPSVCYWYFIKTYYFMKSIVEDTVIY